MEDLGLLPHGGQHLGDPLFQLVIPEGIGIRREHHDQLAVDPVQLVEAVFHRLDQGGLLAQDHLQGQFVAALFQVDQVGLLASQAVHLVAGGIGELHRIQLGKGHLTVNEHPPAAGNAPAQVLLGLKGDGIQARLGHLKLPADPLPGLAEAPPAYGVEADLGGMIGFHSGIPHIRQGKEGGMGAVEGLFPLDLDEDIPGLNLGPHGRDLSVGQGLLGLAHDQFLDEDGLLPGLETDGVEPLGQIEQERRLGVTPGIHQGLAAHLGEFHLRGAYFVAQAIPHHRARIAEDAVEKEIPRLRKGPLSVDGKLQLHAGPPARPGKVDQG